MVIKLIELARHWLLAFGVAFALSFLALVAQAESLKARIIQVSGTTVEARLRGNALPGIGDRATISFEIEGVGLIPLTGSWRVQRITGTTVTLEPAGTVDQPLVGQIVTIEAVEPAVSHRQEPAQGSKAGKLGVPLGEDPYENKSGALTSAGWRSSDEISLEANDYYNGVNGKPRDYAKAFQLYQILLERDEAVGVYNVGVHYAFGNGVEKDFTKAAQYFERGASMEHARSMFNLALLYERGLGVEKNGVRARNYMHQAAATGLVEAYHGLGIYYEKGIGGGKDMDTSISWHRRAAANGFGKSQGWLDELGVN